MVIANDHFNTFFLNNFPTFAIGVAEATFGPNDQTKMPSYDIKVHTALAEHVRRVGIRYGFDLAVTQEFGTQIGGDTNADNVVNSTDFARVRNDFGRSGVDNADFDYNLVVNSLDFTILKSNFGHSGHNMTCP